MDHVSEATERSMQVAIDEVQTSLLSRGRRGDEVYSHSSSTTYSLIYGQWVITDAKHDYAYHTTVPCPGKVILYVRTRD
jgi:hypothetical protein